MHRIPITDRLQRLENTITNVTEEVWHGHKDNSPIGEFTIRKTGETLAVFYTQDASSPLFFGDRSQVSSFLLNKLAVQS